MTNDTILYNALAIACETIEIILDNARDNNHNEPTDRADRLLDVADACALVHYHQTRAIARIKNNKLYINTMNDPHFAAALLDPLNCLISDVSTDHFFATLRALTDLFHELPTD